MPVLSLLNSIFTSLLSFYNRLFRTATQTIENTTAPANMTSTNGSSKSFEAILEEAISPPTHTVAGVVMKAVLSDGSTLYSKAAGRNSVAEGSGPIASDGTFWIASCTKLLTSICALQMVEQGKITLDEDVGRLCPELAHPEIVVEDASAEGGFRLEKAKGKVTLRQLLTHTSGLGYEWMSPTLAAWRKKHGPTAEKLQGRVTATYTHPLLFEPGQGWVYGGSVDWAGIIVHRITGLTLGDYMDKFIFKPLGMTHTCFHLDQRKDVLDKLVPCMYRTPDGKLVPMDTPVFSHTMEEHSGGGGLWSSVPDYTAVLGDLIKTQPTLLKVETIDKMLCAPQLADDSPALATLTQARTATSANAAAAAAGINHGLGGMLMTRDSELSGLPKGTLSWGGLPNLKWFLNREYGVAALYATQIMPPSDGPSNDLSSEFFREVVRLVKERKA